MPTRFPLKKNGSGRNQPPRLCPFRRVLRLVEAPELDRVGAHVGHGGGRHREHPGALEHRRGHLRAWLPRPKMAQGLVPFGSPLKHPEKGSLTKKRLLEKGGLKKRHGQLSTLGAENGRLEGIAWK